MVNNIVRSSVRSVHNTSICRRDVGANRDDRRQMPDVYIFFNFSINCTRHVYIVRRTNYCFVIVTLKSNAHTPPLFLNAMRVAVRRVSCETPNFFGAPHENGAPRSETRRSGTVCIHVYIWFILHLQFYPHVQCIR